MKAELLYNPGNTICDYLKIKNDHKFILRLFINLVYYGHVIGAVTLFVVRSNINLGQKEKILELNGRESLLKARRVKISNQLVMERLHMQIG